jgi:Ca2+-binding RTX toxin-like protein
MPVQVNNTTAQIDFTAANQTWIVAPDVNAGGGVVSNIVFTTLLNYGNVMSTIGAAAYFSEANASVYNFADALMVGFRGVEFHDGQSFLHNEGTIRGNGGGGSGVEANFGTGQVTIENSGDIFGGGSGITFYSSSTVVGSITNSGTIASDQTGIRMLNATGAAIAIVNSGTIKGQTYSIQVQNGDRLNVFNIGTLNGHVRSESVGQADSVTNNKTIIGNVVLGSGNDLYKGTGVVTGIVFGDDGIDTLTGGNSVNRFDGGLGNDTLTGNGGNDILKAGGGNDVILGGLGVDSLTGGANNDYFVLNTAPNSSTNRDVITDFDHVNDTFRMENAIFTKLGAPGALNAAFFRAGAAALDANDYVVYNQATGLLSYDGNGNAAGGLVGLAVLTNKPVLAANDFAVF